MPILQNEGNRLEVSGLLGNAPIASEIITVSCRFTDSNNGPDHIFNRHGCAKSEWRYISDMVEMHV